MEVTTYDRERGLIPVEAAPPAPVVEPTQPADAAPGDGAVQPDSALAPDETAPASSGEETPPAGQGGFQQRIKALTRQKYEMRSQLDQKDLEIARLRAQVAMPQTQRLPVPASPPQPQPSSMSDEPRWDTYNGDSERYWRDLAAHQAKQVVVDVVKTERQRWEAEQQQAQQRPLLEQANARLDDGHVKFDDFDETLTYLSYHIPQDYREGPLIQFLAEDVRGAEVCDYLAKHPDALQELNDRKPAGVVRYLKRLSTQLEGSAPPPSRTAPAVPPVVATLPPVRPLAGTGHTGVPSDNPRDIAERGGSMRDYMRSRGYYVP